MTEEEIQALQNAKAEADRKVAEAEAARDAAIANELKIKTDLNGVVDELKDKRQKLSEALSKMPGNEIDVNSLIENALKSRDEESRKQSWEQALAEFRTSKPEFQSDAAGLVFSKFQSHLNKFNFSDVTDKTSAKNRLEEIYKFVNFKESEGDGGGQDYSGSTQDGGTVPIHTDRMEKDVKVALETSGISEDKYKELSSKYPDALNSLGL